MLPATPPHRAVCATCGCLLDDGSGLCFACLIQCADAPPALAFPDPGQETGPVPRIGHHELLGEIGRGGMGVIYRARDLRTGRLVAMKVLQSHIAHRPELLARFRREAEAAASLDHPHVLPVYEVNEGADGVPFFTMKLASGGSLTKRRAALTGSLREVAALVAKIARAVQHAHEHGVLHRDLKPGNILFDAHGEPLVSDFGLAAWLHQESDLTQPMMVFGTPGYLPPEYVNGRPDVLLPASDLYSLGVILFELLAGRPPTPAATSLSALRDAANRPPPKLRRSVLRADRDLEVICEHCLEPEPALRYRSAAALAEDLEHWLRGEPIRARPTPAVIRAWKFARRHAAITSIAALCLMLAITGATLNHFRQRTAQRLSEATAYDRTVGVLPAEDVETMRIDSVLARQATEFLRMSLRAVPGLPIRESSLSPESVPAGSKLVPYSQELGARYLVTATIRLRGERKRLVVQVIDAIEDQTAVPLVLETTPGAVWPDPQPLLARVREFCVSRGTRNGVAEASKPEGEDEIVEKYVQTGNDLIARGSRGDLDLAIAAFGKALQQKPEHSGALAGLAAALNFRGLHGQRARWDAGALAVAERALLSAPLQASSHRSLSRIFLRRGEIAQAREHGFQAFELDPRDPQAASAIAAAEFEVDAIDRALAWIQRAESRNPSAGAYALHRGDFLAAIGAHDLAERAYLELAEFRPQLPDAPLGLAHIALLKGDAGGSLRTIRELRTRFPNDTRVAQTHAALEFHVGDPLTAEKIYREFADDPDGGLIAYLGVRAASALGYLALQHGEDGRAWIETALRFDREQSQAEPDESVLHYEEGANLALLGRADEALAKLRSAAACSATVSPMLRLDRRLDLLRHDERFNAIIEECEARLAAMRARVQSAHHPQP